MSDRPLPGGVIAAACTPLDDDLNVDVDRLAEHVLRLRKDGCDAVLLFGTTGEGLSFTVDERRRALDGVLDRLEGTSFGARRLLIGTGACALPDAVALTRHAVGHGVGGVLVLPPFHFADASDDGIFLTFDTLIRRVGHEGLHLYFYHYPQLTGVSIGFPVIQRLLDVHAPAIAGIKDSSREWDHMQALQSSFPGLQVFAGTERFLSPVLNEGGAGCISATVNVSAPLAARVLDGIRDGDDVSELQERLTSLRSTLTTFPLIAALKALIARRTNDDAWLRARPPVHALSAQTRAKLDFVAERLGEAYAGS